MSKSTQDENWQDKDRRFAGVANLYGDSGLEKFKQAHVVVIGVGGVGAWTVESLARSGIGELSLIDLDHIAESNINRQLHALDSTLGKAKVIALAERVADINPQCKVHCVEDFISSDNLQAMLGDILRSPNGLIIDCIDHAKTKAALIAWCIRNKLAIITVGAAGGCIHSTRVEIADLSRTVNDILLATTRKHLRQRYNFPRNPKRRFCVPAVYSNESPISPNSKNESPKASDLNCSGYGSVTHVTASFGMAAAGRALSMLLKDLT